MSPQLLRVEVSAPDTSWPGNADGSQHDVVFFKSVFYSAEGKPDGISGVILDITERKRLENEHAQAAREDFLTGVLNLRTFYVLADQAFSRFMRNGEAFSLLVLDLDHFKAINDTLGHEAGDDALRKFVQAVRTHLREQDVFARTGGDEFRLLLPATPQSGALALAERIREEVNRVNLRAPSGSIALSMSAGLCESRRVTKVSTTSFAGPMPRYTRQKRLAVTLLARIAASGIRGAVAGPRVRSCLFRQKARPDPEYLDPEYLDPEYLPTDHGFA